MEAKRRKKRKVIRGLLWLSVVGSFCLALLPVWFPWGLKPVASHYGLRFADYNRIGWSRFALTGVNGEWDGTRLEVQRAECVLPTAWIWHRLHGRSNGPPLLTLSDGHLFIAGSTTDAARTSSADRKGSAGETVTQIQQVGLTLQRWLPVAALTNCSLQVASNLVSIPQADWRAGRLQAVVRSQGLRGEIAIGGWVDGDLPVEFSAAWESYAASLRGGFVRIAEGWQCTGQLGCLTNRATFTAEFATNSWWPVQAQVDCESWQIPAESLPVEGYENLSISLTASYASNRFDLLASGVAQPTDASAQHGFPALKFSLEADGDSVGLNLRKLNIRSPLASAELTNTAGLTWAGELRSEPARLRIAMDLAKLPVATLAGQVEGVVRIEPQGKRLPLVQFQFSMGQASMGQWVVDTALVRGEFAPPVLKLAEFRADFADASTVRAHGAFDIKTGRVQEGHWQLSGGFLQQLFSGVSYATLAASGDVDGPLTNLTHSGEVALAACRTTGLKPFDLKARWSGLHQHLSAANIEVTAGESALSIAASAELDVAKSKIVARLDQLSLRRGKDELYVLQQPGVIRLFTAGTNTVGPWWTLDVDSLDWGSERRSISTRADLAWPAHGNVTLVMTNVAGSDFSDFVEADIANVALAELNAAVQWSNGPVQSVISLAGSMTNSTGHVFELRGTVKTDESLTVEQLTLANDYTPTLSVTGSVPVKVTLEGGAGNLVWNRSRSIALAGDWNDDQAGSLSVPLGTRGHVEVSQPELRVRISGTPAAPAAELTVGAKKLAWFSQTNHSPLPKLEDVQLKVEVRPDTIQLTTFDAKLDGQPITAAGEWPITEEGWRGLLSERILPDWNQARGRLELDAAQVAAFSSYLPEMLSPEGRLSAVMELKPGKHLEGVASLTNAATRPMGTITPLRDIAATVRFAGTRAVLEDFRGQLGGQPVRADGFVAVAGLDGSRLEYQVNLHGTNVPVSRSAELLLRGDFEVSLRGGSNGPPQLSGSVTLRDGLFVQNASALVWSGPVRPEWRPPYFSVTNEPFADWKLDLIVGGDRFLRVRTPVFSGIVSADFQLRGSLGTPVLTGEARVNSGRLIFPFGSLTLNQGFASLTGNDPRGPDLQIYASGRNYRYDLRLEVKGPADGANVILSSTPPLASEEILLMLTAGEIPRSDFAFSNSDRAGRLGTFLGTDLLSRYLGTDPAKERLIFRSGESISGEGRLTYSVEYRLTDRWSIIGAYDEFNAFNADLKWKVFDR